MFTVKQTTTVSWTGKVDHFGATFAALHGILKSVGDVVPIVGTPLRVLAGWCSGSSTQDDKKKIALALENLLGDLDKTYATLNKYSDEDKKDSRLSFEVKVAMKSCSDWAEMIEKKKSTTGLLDAIEAREKSLAFAIQNEVLEQAIRINQKQKVLAGIMKLDKKKTMGIL